MSTTKDDALATRQDPGRPLEQFDVLDVYEGGVAPTEPRVEAIATISAGRMNAKGLPERSTDGTIYLHDPEGRAPGLAAALAKTGGKSLTVTFPFDDPRQFIQQRFVNYSKTRLLAYGDQFRVVSIDEQGNRTEYDRGDHPDDYARVVAECKTAFSVYFVLVEWQDGTPLIVMPDGLGFYRVRFTGRNSARSFMGHLSLLTKFTNGRLAGVPFDLRITQREVSDPKGVKRRIPVFVPTMKVPGMQLDSQNFRGVLQQSITQADRLRLPAPTEETLDDEDTARVFSVDLDALPAGDRTIDLEDADPTEHDIARLQSALDYDTERARFFAIVRDSPYDSDDGRAELLSGFFGEDHGAPLFAGGIEDPSSLRDVLPNVDPEVWDAFLARAEKRVADERERALNRDPASGYPEDVTKAHTKWLEDQLQRLGRAGLDYADRLAFLGYAVGRPLRSNADLTPDVFTELKSALGTLRGTKFTPYTTEQAAAAVIAFAEFRASDEAAEAALA